MGKRRISLLAVLICVFALVFSLGIVSACGDSSASTENEPAANAHWHYGTTAPADNLGNVGDYYLDTESLRAYVLTSNGEWLPTALYSGAGVPDSADGAKGDLYLDTEGGVLYQKGESLWQVVLKVEKGENGRDGVLWFSGAGNPDAAEGTLTDAQTGDFYLNTKEFTVWQLGADGETWNELGTIKGDPGKDAVHFFDGKGTPYGKEGDFEGLKDGDLYLGTFDGFDGSGAGSRLYKYDAAKKEWNVLMDTVQAGQVNIYSYSQLLAFAEKVSKDRIDYAGKVIHLKTDIDFNSVEGASLHRAAPRTVTWSPIGSAEAPFRGTFDGEGHTIKNFTVTTSETGARVGFFGYVEDATIQHLHFENAQVKVSGTDSFGAVVVGHAQNDLTVRDVTVTGSTVEATDENAKVGSLVGSSAGTVTVEEVIVDADDAESPESGREGTTLVGSGEVTFQGENEISYPVVEGVEGFVEKHYKKDSETTVIYEISTLEGLKAFRDSVNGTLESGEEPNNYSGKSVALVANIDLNNEPWTPIASGKGHFYGNFDGKGHKISNLKFIKDDGNTYNSAGLFGDFGGNPLDGKNFVLQNLTIENVELPARSHPTETNPHGNHSNLNDVGAFAGTTYYTDLKNLTLTGEVYIRGGNRVGGIVGRYYFYTDSVVENITVDTNGMIQAGSAGGGIFGELYTSTGNGIQINMSNIALKNVAVKAQQQGGGVIGIIDIQSNNFVLDGVDLTDVKLVPYNPYNDNYKEKFGAIAGNPSKGIIEFKNLRGNISVELDLTLEPEAMGKANFNNNGVFGNGLITPTVSGNNTLVISWYGLSYSLAERTWTVSNVDELVTFASLVNGGYTFEGDTVVLTADNIDLSSVGNWEPIGAGTHSFDGTFDGQNHSLSNLTINTDDTAEYKWGFFSILKGTVKDVVFEDIDIFAQNAHGVGAVAAQCENATISNVKVHIKEGRSTEGYKWVGGLVGYATSLTASGNEVSGSIKFTNQKAGGLVGLVLSSGNNFENNRLHDLTISTTDWDYMGGLIGGTSGANYGVTMNGNTFTNVTLDGSQGAQTNGGDIGALMGNVGDGPYYSRDNSGTVIVIAKSGTNIHHKGLWGRDPANLENSSNPNLTVVWNGIEVTEKSYSLASSEELTLFRDWVNSGNTFEGETVVLTADVDLASVGNWTPIGKNTYPFKGTFMGGTVTDGEIVPTVRKISNMTIAKTGSEEGLEGDDKKFAGFFAFTQNAVISDLHFVKANVTNTYAESDGAAGYCAVLVGRTNGGKLEISNVTIGEKPEDTEEGKRAHAQEAPYVTSGKAVAAFVSRSTGDGSITFDNCVNYANLCAPKAAGFLAQFQSKDNTPLTIKNSANYGNITMPQTKEALCDSPDVAMGGFIGYIQSSSEVLLVNCVNEGNIDATITQVKKSVGKLNVGGLISSVHSAAGKTTLVDCINRGNIVINQSLTEGTACDGEIGGLIGSTGATMYHVEQLGDITVTNTSDKPMHVGGVVGSEDKGVLHMKNRSEYADLAAPEKGSRVERYDSDLNTGEKPDLANYSNIVYCDITVTSSNSTVLLGGATGNGNDSNTIDSTFVSLYAEVNGENLYNKEDSLVLSGMTGAGNYTITNSVLHLAAIKDRGLDGVVKWDAE